MFKYRFFETDVVITNDTSQHTVITLDEDLLGGLLTDDYATGIKLVCVTRCDENSTYNAVVLGTLHFSRMSGVIEGLGYSQIASIGTAPTIAVSDEAPNIAAKLTAAHVTLAKHRIWLKLLAQNDS